MNYPKHHVTIGESGLVKANVVARIIIVDGTVEGDIEAEEAVYLSHTAHVLGNIKSPRVSIAEGATLDGGLKTS
jgi:cytoskeletal protein CcmA (bactofilin family)